jgi:hypothetical protein
VFLSVSDVDRSVAFHLAALVPLRITQRHDFDDKDGPAGHPDGYGLEFSHKSWQHPQS